MTPWTVACQLCPGHFPGKILEGCHFHQRHLPDPGLNQNLLQCAVLLPPSHLGSLVLSLFEIKLKFLVKDAPATPMDLDGRPCDAITDNPSVRGIEMYLIKILFAHTVASMRYEWLEHQSKGARQHPDLSSYRFSFLPGLLIVVSLP